MRGQEVKLSLMVHLNHQHCNVSGHLIFEMSAGYELKQLAPTRDEYKTVPKAIKPILEFIFNEELSHSISEVSLSKSILFYADFFNSHMIII